MIDQTLDQYLSAQSAEQADTVRQDDLNELERLAQEVNQLKAKLKEANQTHNAEATAKHLQTELDAADLSLSKMLRDMPTPRQRAAIKAMLESPEQFCADAQWWCATLADEQSRHKAGTL